MYVLAILILFISLSHTSHANNFAKDSIIDKIQVLQPAIVTVNTELVKIINIPNSHSRRTATYTRSGAGIIIDKSGIVVTNTHTVINAPHVFVTLSNGKKIEAQVLYASLGYDFSLLKINTSEILTPINLADSNMLNVGDPIISVGNSDFNQSSLLSGQIVNLVTSKSSGNVEFIEINVNLHKGDSGGPVFDLNGRLIGIVMAKHKSMQQIAVIIAINKIRDEYLLYKQNMP